jgi:hypothetical protein
MAVVTGSGTFCQPAFVTDPARIERLAAVFQRVCVRLDGCHRGQPALRVLGTQAGGRFIWQVVGCVLSAGLHTASERKP